MFIAIILHVIVYTPLFIYCQFDNVNVCINLYGNIEINVSVSIRAQKSHNHGWKSAIKGVKIADHMQPCPTSWLWTHWSSTLSPVVSVALSYAREISLSWTSKTRWMSSVSQFLDVSTSLYHILLILKRTYTCT